MLFLENFILIFHYVTKSVDLVKRNVLTEKYTKILASLLLHNEMQKFKQFDHKGDHTKASNSHCYQLNKASYVIKSLLETLYPF